MHHSFHIAESLYDANAFGNVSIVATSDACAVRYTLDRGDHLLAIQHDSHWFAIDEIRNLLYGANCPEDTSWRDQVAFIEAHIAEIKAVFAPNRVEQTLQDLRRISAEKLRRMFPGAIQEDSER